MLNFLKRIIQTSHDQSVIYLHDESILLLKLCPANPILNVRMTHYEPLEDHPRPFQLFVPEIFQNCSSFEKKIMKSYLAW